MTSLLRWMLLVPASITAWYLALFAAIALLGGLVGLCPQDQIVSGTCVAPWYHAAEQVVMCAGAGLAAVLILAVCALLAPAHKPKVAIAAYVTGVLVACAMGIATDAYAATASAVLVGAGMLVLLLRRLARKPASDGAISRS